MCISTFSLLTRPLRKSHVVCHREILSKFQKHFFHLSTSFRQHSPMVSHHRQINKNFDQKTHLNHFGQFKVITKSDHKLKCIRSSFQCSPLKILSSKPYPPAFESSAWIVFGRYNSYGIRFKPVRFEPVRFANSHMSRHYHGNPLPLTQFLPLIRRAHKF